MQRRAVTEIIRCQVYVRLACGHETYVSRKDFKALLRATPKVGSQLACYFCPKHDPEVQP